MNTTEQIQHLERQIKRYYKFQAKNSGTQVGTVTSFFIDQLRAELAELKK